jgi:hypothetical protein
MSVESHTTWPLPLSIEYSIFNVDIDLEQPGKENVLFDKSTGNIVYFKITDPGPTPSQTGGYLNIITLPKNTSGSFIYADQYKDLLRRDYAFKPDGSEIAIYDQRLRAVTADEQKKLQPLSATINTCKDCNHIEHYEWIDAVKTFWATPDYYITPDAARP